MPQTCEGGPISERRPIAGSTDTIGRRRVRLAYSGCADGLWPEEIVLVAEHFAESTELPDDDDDWCSRLEGLAYALQDAGDEACRDWYDEKERAG